MFLTIRIHYLPGILLITVIVINSCTTPGPGLFAKKSPHEQYGQRIIDAGLRETALGRSWFEAAERSLRAPLSITLPYNERGFFAAERPQASGWQFSAKRGERVHITVDKTPSTGFSVYFDLWEAADAGRATPKLLAAADTMGNPLQYEIKADALYTLRLQPELLKSGEYTLTVSTGPSLGFPIPEKVKSNIGSFWGAGRDRGARKHEGIDIFAAFRSPVVAAADGVVTQVNENRLGGKVVFLRPEQRNYTLYYAHLDSQFVTGGQFVHKGDTLGLVGNTGNARSTAPHLHFGIYAIGGAIDPLPFVNPVIRSPSKISVPLVNIGKPMRSIGKSSLHAAPGTGSPATAALETNTLLQVDAASGSWYKAILPNGQTGYVNSTSVNPLDKPLRRLVVSTQVPLFNEPDSSAPRRAFIGKGEAINILAGFKGFYYVRNQTDVTGWVNQQGL